MTSTRHLVDRDLLPGLAKRQPLAFSSRDLPSVRAAMLESRSADASMETPGVRSENLVVNRGRKAPPVRVTEYRPMQATKPLHAILHVHVRRR